jgi:anti-sigma factor RsiW
MKVEKDTGACPEDALLDAFARGTLDARQAGAVEAHVGGCAACRAALADYREGERYGELLREWRAKLAPALRRRVIQSATEICDSRSGSDRRAGEGTGGRDEPSSSAARS